MDARSDHEAKLSLPSDREILVVRSFQAPRTMLFDAWTRPEHLKRWYPCATLTMRVCEIDLREGGKWRWVLHDPVHGVDHATSGEYREIMRPERLVFSERYEPMPGSDHLVTLTFAERNGVTTVTQHILHGSKANRDAHLEAGIERGLQETFARLDELLESITT